MADIQLICLDFDGTFMVYDEPPGFMHPAVVAELNRLGGAGIRWCTNSGRDRGSQLEVLELSREKGLRHKPVGLLACESLIYHQRNGSYQGHESWNKQAHRLLRTFHGALQGLLADAMPDLLRRYKPDLMYVNEEATAFCIPQKDDGPLRFYQELKPYVEKIENGALSRNGGWVAALPAELGKGALLETFGRDLGIAAEHILAVGDHINDISMLDGTAAGHVGCPADAVVEVIETVRRAGGMVSAYDGPLGTVEILEQVCGGVEQR